LGENVTSIPFPLFRIIDAAWQMLTSSDCDDDAKFIESSSESGIPDKAFSIKPFRASWMPSSGSTLDAKGNMLTLTDAVARGSSMFVL
jgi:hypothetical protein